MTDDSTMETTQCPHCDRSEKFGDEPTARAWMTAHILSYHRDELPDPGVNDGG